MKKVSNYKRVAGYLDKMEKALSKEYFEETLPPTVVAIRDLRGRQGCYAQEDLWYCEEGESFQEITVSPDILAEPIEEIAAVLLHQMVHQFCYINQIKDCSRGGVYHNSRFAEEAFRRGLLVDYDQKVGFGKTMPSERLIDFCEEKEFSQITIWKACIQTESFTEVNGNEDYQKKQKKSSNSIRYVCPNCSCIARATKKIYLICGSCHRDMLVSSK